MVSCDCCNAPEAKFKCSACKCNYYCNRTCATNHWKNGHKAECKSMAAHIANFNSTDTHISSSIFKLEEAHSSKEECCICLNVLVRETSFILPWYLLTHLLTHSPNHLLTHSLTQVSIFSVMTVSLLN